MKAVETSWLVMMNSSEVQRGCVLGQGGARAQEQEISSPDRPAEGLGHEVVALGEDLEAVLDAWPEAGDEDLDEAEDALSVSVARVALGPDILEGDDEESDRGDEDDTLDDEDDGDEDKDKDDLRVI